ncbi:MAG: DsrE family protein [Rubrivivax sp.]
MTQKVLLIVHAPPYGSERCLSALRVANSLAGLEAPATPELKVFLMSDATVLALPNQQDGGGNGLQKMVEELTGRKVPVIVCKTCALARGLAELPLIPGTRIGTLAELAQATLWADKVITF